MTTSTKSEDVEALAVELDEAFRCRCDPAYTDRGLHAPDCQGYMLPDTTAVLRALLAERDALREALTSDWLNEQDEWTEKIEAAHPFKEPKDFPRYNLAIKMVSARHSKLELIKLVAWLLTFKK